MDTTAAAGRPWAQGIGLLVLGLAISAIASSVGLGGGATPALAALGVMGYLAGLVVAGSGVHRILWFGPARRARATRLVVTAVVTVPAFFGAALLLSVFMSVFQRRFIP